MAFQKKKRRPQKFKPKVLPKNHTPILHGSGTLLRLLSEGLEINRIPHVMSINQHRYGYIEPASKGHYQKFAEFVESIQNEYPGYILDDN